MDQGDSEKSVAELQRQQGEPVQHHVVTPEGVRDMAFSKPAAGKRGYDEDEVDAFLERVDAALRSATRSTLTPDQVRNVAFSKPRLGKRGYDEDEVDAFCDSVEQEMRRRAGSANHGPQQLAFAPPPQAGFTSPPAPPPQRTAYGRVARGGRVLLVLVVGLFGLYVIAWGGYGLWAGHSGVPARVDIVDCGNTSIFGPMKGPGGGFTRDCSAVWRLADGSEELVTVHFIRSPHEGQIVDVHIHGDQAYTNSGWVIAYIAVGFIFLGAMLLPMWLGRASRASRSDDPGTPPRAKHSR